MGTPPFYKHGYLKKVIFSLPDSCSEHFHRRLNLIIDSVALHSTLTFSTCDCTFELKTGVREIIEDFKLLLILKL